MNRSSLLRIASLGMILIIIVALVGTLSAFAIPEVRLWALGCPDKNKITEMTLSRSQCLGTCPLYKILLRRDGTALYRGGANVPLVGDYIGSIDPETFARLARIVQSRGYFKLWDYYTDNLTDGPTYTVSVVCDGVRKIVSDYDGAGPAELHAVQDAIDNVAGPIQWQKWQKPAPPAPDPFSDAEWPGRSILDL